MEESLLLTEYPVSLTYYLLYQYWLVYTSMSSYQKYNKYQEKQRKLTAMISRQKYLPPLPFYTTTSHYVQLYISSGSWLSWPNIVNSCIKLEHILLVLLCKIIRQRKLPYDVLSVIHSYCHGVNPPILIEGAETSSRNKILSEHRLESERIGMIPMVTYQLPRLNVSRCYAHNLPIVIISSFESPLQWYFHGMENWTV